MHPLKDNDTHRTSHTISDLKLFADVSGMMQIIACVLDRIKVCGTEFKIKCSSPQAKPPKGIRIMDIICSLVAIYWHIYYL